MIVTVTTVRDTVANVERFVRRNCTQGVDHMVVVVDGDQPDLLAALAGDPRVSVVAGDATWWGPGRRPGGLNTRQALSAHAVSCALAHLGWDAWLFPVDADEVVHLDRFEVDALGRRVRSLRLRVLEALSSTDEADAGWFKRVLGPREEARARAEGLVGRPGDPAWFHGHVAKVGVRPDVSVQLRLHGARTADGAKVPALALASARLLHFESADPTEFVRKWRNLVEAGPDRMGLRPERRELAARFAAVLRSGPPGPEVDAGLRALYRDFVEDRHGRALRERGLLEHVEVDVPRWAARPLGEQARHELAEALGRLATVDKRELFAGGAERRRRLLASA